MLGTSMKLIAPLVLGLHLWVPHANCQSVRDGQLVHQNTVSLTEEELRELEGSWQDCRTALGSVELKHITYLSDGLKVKGYLASPKGGGRLPCVIFNRGGNRDFGALDNRRAAALLGPIAIRGYVAVASQYRGNEGGEGQEEFGGRDINDVLNLIPLLESLDIADASRIGMYGWSRGGMMTYQALARTDKVSAAIIGAAPTDLFDLLKRRPEMEKFVLSELVPDYERNKEKELVARSVIRWPEKLHKRTPLLILHGSADWRVHPSSSLRIVPKLFELKHPVRFVFFEGGDHGLSEHRAEVDSLVHKWLDRYVRDKKPWPSLEPHGR